MNNNCCDEIKVINYKSDFKLIEEPVKGFSITNAPFKFTYYIRPSRSYIASYDGKVFNNCTITDDGKLIVAFDNHNLGVGRLKVKREFYLNDPQYNSGICDLVTEEELDLILDKNIKSDYIEITSTIYPYYHLLGLGNSEDFEKNEEGNLAISQKFKDSKQDTLVSGSNIKTINGESLLGEGNINIQSDSGGGTSLIEVTDNPKEIPTDNTIAINTSNGKVFFGIANKGWWFVTAQMLGGSAEIDGNTLKISAEYYNGTIAVSGEVKDGLLIL